ncbi:MAG: DUF3159 domain-containing protein [Anaerolineaceae bacterium]|nr:MAG: DUF3159 domain-containing protein [Anaerolineaceae bacterium]
MEKLQELLEEFRSVVAGRQKIIDSILPPLTFVIVNELADVNYALWSSLGMALVFTMFRLFKGESVGYAVGGLGGVIAAIAIVKLLGRTEGFFVPALVSGSLTFVLCLVSIIIKRPLVAFTSHITRRWPLGWYWHPKVVAAYQEVTFFWTIFFALRVLVQIAILQGGTSNFFAIINIILGWPALIVLLAGSYLYGSWRLRRLQGPSIEEYDRGDPPPWTGQLRGF